MKWSVEERTKQLLVLGREHYERREFDRAEQMLSEILRFEDGYADVHNMMGIILHGRGDFEQASIHFARALELNPVYTEARLNLVVCYNDLGRYTEARAVYDLLHAPNATDGRGLRDDYAIGKIANMHAAVAQAYADAGCPDEALAEMGRACALRPGFADLRVKLAAMYRDVGQGDRALAELETACLSNPTYAPARIALGVAILAAGRADEARTHFERALAIDPQSRNAAMYLRLLATRV